MFILQSSAFSAGGMSAHMQRVDIDVSDKAVLQRGARLYMNYCSGCHSLKYLRYSQMAKGLGLFANDGKPGGDLLHNNLIFTSATVHDPVTIAMPEVDSRQWFGVVPPDLSLVARVRGSDWLYTYLKGFYEDTSKPFGTNNLIFPDVAMPNVLYNLQGRQIAVFKEQTEQAHGESRTTRVLRNLQVIEPGEMSAPEFERSVIDLVTFLAFVGEPLQLERAGLGFWVLGFLVILLFFSYLLKKEYWRALKK
jgi:ubiquinol-cytochrome c reductase cytochrome c1 subunit